MQLSLCVTDHRLRPLYEQRRNHATDCGFDLYNRTEDGADCITIPARARAFKIFTGIKAAPHDHHGYYLYPRSSIIKTPLRLANSVGIIDPTYRGEIIAAVDNLSDSDFVLQRNTSLFQLCMPDLRAFPVVFTDSLDSTARGDGGFGSTH
jgi:dUTP pyrophosphatase